MSVNILRETRAERHCSHKVKTEYFKNKTDKNTGRRAKHEIEWQNKKKSGKFTNIPTSVLIILLCSKRFKEKYPYSESMKWHEPGCFLGGRGRRSWSLRPGWTIEQVRGWPDSWVLPCLKAETIKRAGAPGSGGVLPTLRPQLWRVREQGGGREKKKKQRNKQQTNQQINGWMGQEGNMTMPSFNSHTESGPWGPGEGYHIPMST